MSFAAQCPCLCDECGGLIYPGDSIFPVDHDGDRIYAHETCPDDSSASRWLGEMVCPECFMVRPCGCDDEREEQER